MAARKLGETPSSARVVLIVDQFEETFAECREDTKLFMSGYGEFRYLVGCFTGCDLSGVDHVRRVG